MPKQTLGGLQDELYEEAYVLFAIADTLDPINLDPDDDDDPEEDEQTLMLPRDDSNVAAVLRIYGALAAEEAESMKGDGTRGPYFQVDKSKDWFSCALRMPDREFRSIFRIGRPTFNTFCEILSRNQIFTSRGRKPQRPISWQLGAFLIRYGQLGSPVHDTSFKLGIAVGTVVLYCRRVTRAVRELKKEYGSWFSEEHQLETSTSIEEKIGFPDCVGSGDGSLFQTSEQPSWMGPAYLSRKGFFAYALFAIVDSDLRFGAWELGWPGSVTDARVFKNSHFWQHRHQYLQHDRYILVDKGYPSTPYTVRPFSEPELAKASARDKKRMKDFNFTLSSERIRVEHAFGCFKLRFQSARMMGGHKDVQDVWRTIDALLILHNMCLYHGDHPKHLEEYRLDLGNDRTGEERVEPDPNDFFVFQPPEVPAIETGPWLKEQGLALRQKLLDLVCPVGNY